MLWGLIRNAQFCCHKDSQKLSKVLLNHWVLLPQRRLEMSGDLVKINWFCWRTHGRICLEVSFKKHRVFLPQKQPDVSRGLVKNTRYCLPKRGSRCARSRNHKNSRMCPEVSLGHVSLSSQTWLETFFHDFLSKILFCCTNLVSHVQMFNRCASLACHPCHL